MKFSSKFYNTKVTDNKICIESSLKYGWSLSNGAYPVVFSKGLRIILSPLTYVDESIQKR